MAGQGPPPKPANQRARRNKDPIAQTVLRAEHVEPPPFPDRYKSSPQVTYWWETWVGSAQSDHFSATDWLGLLETLPLVYAYHHEEGGLKHGPEIRLRVAAYGATPADRARLRYTFAQADEADRRRDSRNATGAAERRYEGLRIVNE